MHSNNSTDALDFQMPTWAYGGQIMYTILIILLGIPGNTIVILVFVNLKVKYSTDYLVFGMGVSDLIGSSVVSTFYILRNIPGDSMQKLIGGTWMCRLSEYSGLFTHFSSTYLMGMIALDRCLKTCRPYSTIFTAYRAKIICIIIFLIVAICSGPAVHMFTYDPHLGICFFESNIDIAALVLLTNSVIALLSGVVTTVAYILVGIVLVKRHNNKLKRTIAYPSTAVCGRNRPPIPSKSRKTNTSVIDTTQETKIQTANMPYTNSASPIPSISDHRVTITMPSAHLIFDSGSKIQKTESQPRGVGEKADTGRPIAATDVDIIIDPASLTEKTKQTVLYGGNNKHPSYNAGNKPMINPAIRESERKINRTTRVMFLITSTYIVSYMITIAADVYSGANISDPSLPGFAIAYIAKTTFMINCVTNPVFYACMSAMFRERVRKLFNRYK